MTKLTTKQLIYVLLAILGIVLPWYFNIQFIQELSGRFDLIAFVSGGFANTAASSMTVDFAIVVLAMVTWLVTEAKKLGMKHWWVYIGLMFLVSAAFAIPLFLFMRERRLEQS